MDSDDEQLLRGRIYGADHEHPGPKPGRRYVELVGGPLGGLLLNITQLGDEPGGMPGGQFVERDTEPVGELRTSSEGRTRLGSHVAMYAPSGSGFERAEAAPGPALRGGRTQVGWGGKGAGCAAGCRGGVRRLTRRREPVRRDSASTGCEHPQP